MSITDGSMGVPASAAGVDEHDAVRDAGGVGGVRSVKAPASSRLRVGDSKCQEAVMPPSVAAFARAALGGGRRWTPLATCRHSGRRQCIGAGRARRRWHGRRGCSAPGDAQPALQGWFRAAPGHRRNAPYDLCNPATAKCGGKQGRRHRASSSRSAVHQVRHDDQQGIGRVDGQSECPSPVPARRVAFQSKVAGAASRNNSRTTVIPATEGGKPAIDS